VCNQDSSRSPPKKSETDEDSKSGTTKTSQITIKTRRIMRIPPENLINPMSLFWYLVYAAALFLIFVTGILAGSRDPQKAPAKN
jgi:hypothetical protein